MSTPAGPPIHLLPGDCRQVLAGLPADSLDALVTDPPYGLSQEPDVAEVMRHWLAGTPYAHGSSGFMGKSWDSFVPGPEYWREAYRVLKPGAHALVFAGTRTADLMSIALRFAGFEIRDSLHWVYGSGFPKSLSVSKALDKAAGAERQVVGEGEAFGRGSLRNRSRVEQGYRPTELNPEGGVAQITAPATDAAKRWDGWGTALKPAHEPILLARKPLVGTVAANVLAHGTGALNIDGSRIGTTKDVPASPSRSAGRVLGGSADGSLRHETGAEGGHNPAVGRWPANFILSHHPACRPAGTEAVAAYDCHPVCPVRALDAQSGTSKSSGGKTGRVGCGGKYNGGWTGDNPGATAGGFGDTGGASRFFAVLPPEQPFFYCAKAARKERDAGAVPNTHPTVKPLKLLTYLVRLVTPPGGTVLDPFVGSGTTALACLEAGFGCVGIDQDQDYIALAAARLTERYRALAAAAPAA